LRKGRLERMRCPQCGRENPDDARYCSNCLTNLELLKKDQQMPEEGFVYRVTERPSAGAKATAPPPSSITGGSAPQPTYHSVSEWREVAARQPTTPPVARKRGIGGVKLDWAIYGGIVLAIVVAIILLITVWKNPMPEGVAREFMAALNRKDIAAMSEYVYSAGGSDLALEELAVRIGEGGGFEGLSFQAEEVNNYEAIVNITGGTFNPGGTGFPVEITPESRLMLKMESHQGHWYIILSASRIFP